MASKIFINYRRSVNLKDAQLLELALRRHFGKSRIFLDLSGLDGGDHWLHKLQRQVDDAAVMVSLIGKGWADIRDEKSNRRLDNSNDFVRFELAHAFSRNIPILPLLIDGAPMPEISHLPPQLAELASRQAMLLRAESYTEDADKIALRVRSLINTVRPPGLPPWQAVALCLVALLIGFGASMLLGSLGVPVLSGRQKLSLQNPPDYIAAIVNHPLDRCSADRQGTAVQLFEHGWLLARFAPSATYLYAVIRRQGDAVSWTKRTQEFYPDLKENKCNTLVAEGFEWWYCSSDEIRGALGEPLIAETLALVQYQPWSQGMLIVGIPRGAKGVANGRFDDLASFFLENEQNVQKGEGRFSSISYPNANSMEHCKAHCNAVWYAGATPRTDQWKPHPIFLREDCTEPHSENEFFEKRETCSVCLADR
jgi:hypothetical protein